MTNRRPTRTTRPTLLRARDPPRSKPCPRSAAAGRSGTSDRVGLAQAGTGRRIRVADNQAEDNQAEDNQAEDNQVGILGTARTAPGCPAVAKAGAAARPVVVL